MEEMMPVKAACEAIDMIHRQAYEYYKREISRAVRDERLGFAKEIRDWTRQLDDCEGSDAIAIVGELNEWANDLVLLALYGGPI